MVAACYNPVVTLNTPVTRHLAFYPPSNELHRRSPPTQQALSRCYNWPSYNWPQIHTLDLSVH